MSEIKPGANQQGATPEEQGRGMLIVVSSPSGGGKGTLIRRALKTVPSLGYSVSFTTRPQRAGEIDGVHYHFVPPQTFAEMQQEGDFLEYALVHGNLYGTAYTEVRRELSRRRDIILEIDVQGAASVRNRVENVVSIFILPPSLEILTERLSGRGSEKPADLALRLSNSRGEVERYREFDYLILNDDAEVASAELASIVYAERLRRERQEELARRVLSTFL